MPPRTRTTATPKKLRQKKLDTFLSSSPARSTQKSSPTRPPRRKRTKRARYDGEDDEPGPSRIPGDDEDGSQSSDPGAIRFEPTAVVDISSSEDELDVAPRPTPANKGKKRVRRAHSEESASASPSEDDERELFVRKGKRAAKASASMVLDSEEEEELSPTRKRKLVKGQRPPTPEEDEADLLDEVEEERTSL